jgi:hypothetical protein
MSDHAKFSPSSLARVAACPGSPNLIAQLPEDQRKSPDTAASLQGTLRHAMLAERVAAHLLRDTSGVVLASTPTADDWRAVDAVWGRIKDHPALTQRLGHKCWSEQAVEIGKWCGLPPEELWGTADLILATPSVLEIADAKFGQRIVQPDTLQLKAYAVGAGALLIDPATGQFAPEHRQVRNVRLTILQPANPQVVTSETYPLDVLQTWAKELGAVVKAAQAPDAPLNPGDHCTFCPAGTTCPARNQAARAAVSGMFNILTGELTITEETPQQSHAPLDEVEALLDLRPEELSADQIGRILDLAPPVEELFKALRKRAEAALKAGGTVPGWKLIEGRRSREWTIPEDGLAAELRRIGLKASEFQKITIQSPAQLEKVVQASGIKKRVERFGAMWKWKEGGPVLAPEGSPEPAWRAPEAMFEQVVENPQDVDWL